MNTTPFRCHDADACASGQNACPTPSICGCAAPKCAVKDGTHKPADAVHQIEEPDAAATASVQADTPTDDELRMMWIAAGGDFFGPKTVTCSMPESKLLPLLRRFATQPTQQGLDTVAPALANAFITSESDGAAGSYKLVAKFKTLPELQAAHSAVVTGIAAKAKQGG